MYFVIAALVIGGWIALFAGFRRTQRTCAELRLEFQRQIDSLSAGIRALEQAAAARIASTALRAIEEPVKMERVVEISKPPIAAQVQGSEEIPPETLAKLSETIAAWLGKKVRIRSVKMLPTPNAVLNPWAQQGRVVVQASHYLEHGGRER